ncbi:hypothetical protein [Streptomyces sp. NPDC097619]|uniref:hypothetical protein n=1 Tax=Streptomyces sp. NPDC097619 TaxID=3157228 RepID=UPI00332B07A7
MRNQHQEQYENQGRNQNQGPTHDRDRDRDRSEGHENRPDTPRAAREPHSAHPTGERIHPVPGADPRAEVPAGPPLTPPSAAPGTVPAPRDRRADSDHGSWAATETWDDGAGRLDPAAPGTSGPTKHDSEHDTHLTPHTNNAHGTNTTHAPTPTPETETGTGTGTGTQSPTSSTSDGPDREPLIPAADSTDFRERWTRIQVGFVDDPQEAVRDADALVAETMRHLTESFEERRKSLEKQWQGGGEAATEDLRLSLQRYRSFFGRLLDT